MKREVAVAVLASEGLSLVSVSARTASSVVVVSTPKDPMAFHKSTRDLKAQSAAKDHCETVVVILTSEGLVVILVSHQHARSSFVPSLFLFFRTCLYVRARETGDWDLFLGPLEWARVETGGAD